jgi:hypothetical protein
LTQTGLVPVAQLLGEDFDRVGAPGVAQDDHRLDASQQVLVEQRGELRQQDLVVGVQERRIVVVPRRRQGFEQVVRRILESPGRGALGPVGGLEQGLDIRLARQLMHHPFDERPDRAEIGLALATSHRLDLIDRLRVGPGADLEERIRQGILGTRIQERLGGFNLLLLLRRGSTLPGHRHQPWPSSAPFAGAAPDLVAPSRPWRAEPPASSSHRLALAGAAPDFVCGASAAFVFEAGGRPPDCAGRLGAKAPPNMSQSHIHEHPRGILGASDLLMFANLWVNPRRSVPASEPPTGRIVPCTEPNRVRAFAEAEGGAGRPGQTLSETQWKSRET